MRACILFLYKANNNAEFEVDAAIIIAFTSTSDTGNGEVQLSC